MSSARQTVTPGESLSGAGNVRAWTRRHSVDFENGTSASTSGWRTKPISGSTGAVVEALRAAVATAEGEIVVGMIRPCFGIRRWKGMTCSVAVASVEVCVAARNVNKSMHRRRS